jgi:hypothetical protein
MKDSIYFIFFKGQYGAELRQAQALLSLHNVNELADTSKGTIQSYEICF